MVERHSDILILGGGIIGLAIALDLQQQGATVTLLSKRFEEAASQAAAGMLAPRAEGLPPGPLLDLALASLAAYGDWVAKLEYLTGESVGYWPCGILAPRSVLPAASDPGAPWLPASILAHYQPGLGSQIRGGYWYPEEGQVDNQALAKVLRRAAIEAGVNLQEGVEATALVHQRGAIGQVLTAQAGAFGADLVVLAGGAWSQQLLPLPISPRKGEMVGLRVPIGYDQPQPLRRVLFGEDIYIVPRQDGRIVLGATSQAVGFTAGNTAAGVHQLLQRAIALWPTLADFTLERTWWGYRPATPDEWPILGPGPATNLILATGHYRNGILLAPITAQLIGQLCRGDTPARLTPFSWQRFHHPSTSAPYPSATLPMTSAPLTLATASQAQPLETEDSPLVIAGRSFHSRLMTGTGKYDSFAVMRQSIQASGCEIVTVAVRRVQTQAPGHEGLAEALDWSRIWMLPNTAGCQTAEEAIRVARLGREMAKLLGQEDNNFVKLEVIPDSKYLLPDPIGTLAAAEQLVKEGFAVLPYINADPLLAKRLEEVGCATVMPLGSPIGSGQGIRNSANIQIIIENAGVPVVVDAGIGTPSEAAAAMEMGADALLINTAIAKATDPVAMGRAMGLATTAGRLAYRAGRIPVRQIASASSPQTGIVA
jgi:thiazole synthase